MAAALATRPGTKVLFVSDRARREVRIPGARRILVPMPQAPSTQDRTEYEALMALRRGAKIANALLRLRDAGFVPDMVVSTAGQGCGLYVRDIFPQAFLVSYADWFHTKGAEHTFFTHGKARPAADFAPDRVRNLFQWNALGECHLGITSTHWQRSLYPPALGKRIHVLHEGIDTDFFSPAQGQRFCIDGCDLSGVEELVTFSGRRLEPHRGFPQFFRSIPHILQARPRSHVLIMANVDSAHSTGSLLQSLGVEGLVDMSRVHLVGFRPYEDYRMLLRASTVHVFLTAPFALSSGLFEAMSCGCLLVGADTEPVREVIEHGGNGFLCDFWDSETLGHTVSTLLECAPQMLPLREAARQTIVQQFNVRTQSAQGVELLLQSHARWQAAGSPALWAEDRQGLEGLTEEL